MSIKDQSLLKSLEICGKKNVIFNWLVLYKIKVPPENLPQVINNIQKSMVENFWFYFPHFYTHFYRDNELIVVFKHKIFRVTPDSSTWGELLAYGKSLGIPQKQLDFFPCRFEDEAY